MAGPPPPPPKGAERRQHKRVEILASVEVLAGGDVLLFSATNLSIGGLFLEAEPQEHPELARGVELALTLTVEAPAAARPAGAPPPPPKTVRAVGKVVRVQATAPGVPGGFGVVITKIGGADLERLRSLLG